MSHSNTMACDMANQPHMNTIIYNKHKHEYSGVGREQVSSFILYVCYICVNMYAYITWMSWVCEHVAKEIWEELLNNLCVCVVLPHRRAVLHHGVVELVALGSAPRKEAALTHVIVEMLQTAIPRKRGGERKGGEDEISCVGKLCVSMSL